MQSEKDPQSSILEAARWQAGGRAVTKKEKSTTEAVAKGLPCYQVDERLSGASRVLLIYYSL